MGTVALRKSGAYFSTMNPPADRRPDTPAEPASAGPAATPLFMRIFWYGVAGVVTIALNPALFRLFNRTLGWNNYTAYAVSLTLVNVLQFIWSYFVGFRTSERWTVSARRQGAVLVAANVLNYGLVVALQAVVPAWKEAVIVAVQVVIAAVKFAVYHYWVYPDRPAPAERA